ncbi:Hypothetical Protein FCC1311_083422 [Hondaea fermentalgiana]|uniref:Uncharacterized protein n=1 Tax=Hondaea fermentalgiana TaxID=2315210 RepID=A0A2R5GMK2_9STRA|nr:Hypothetical Protein FCC1311_083422 [Hondaea fermentalgiana]|eukprot:GBG32117.1 Hypothetical Protein FCC1311_083422 [Hondaea fermentalgiana]
MSAPWVVLEWMGEATGTGPRPATTGAKRPRKGRAETTKTRGQALQPRVGGLAQGLAKAVMQNLAALNAEPLEENSRELVDAAISRGAKALRADAIGAEAETSKSKRARRGAADEDEIKRARKRVALADKTGELIRVYREKLERDLETLSEETEANCAGRNGDGAQVAVQGDDDEGEVASRRPSAQSRLSQRLSRRLSRTRRWVQGGSSDAGSEPLMEVSYRGISVAAINDIWEAFENNALAPGMEISHNGDRGKAVRIVRAGTKRRVNENGEFSVRSVTNLNWMFGGNQEPGIDSLHGRNPRFPRKVFTYHRNDLVSMPRLSWRLRDVVDFILVPEELKSGLPSGERLAVASAEPYAGVLVIVDDNIRFSSFQSALKRYAEREGVGSDEVHIWSLELGIHHSSIRIPETASPDEETRAKKFYAEELADAMQKFDKVLVVLNENLEGIRRSDVVFSIYQAARAGKPIELVWPQQGSGDAEEMGYFLDSPYEWTQCYRNPNLELGLLQNGYMMGFGQMDLICSKIVLEAQDDAEEAVRSFVDTVQPVLALCMGDAIEEHVETCLTTKTQRSAQSLLGAARLFNELKRFEQGRITASRCIDMIHEVAREAKEKEQMSSEEARGDNDEEDDEERDPANTSNGLADEENAEDAQQARPEGIGMDDVAAEDAEVAEDAEDAADVAPDAEANGVLRANFGGAWMSSSLFASDSAETPLERMLSLEYDLLLCIASSLHGEEKFEEAEAAYDTVLAYLREKDKLHTIKHGEVVRDAARNLRKIEGRESDAERIAKDFVAEMRSQEDMETSTLRNALFYILEDLAQFADRDFRFEDSLESYLILEEICEKYADETQSIDYTLMATRSSIFRLRTEVSSDEELKAEAEKQQESAAASFFDGFAGSAKWSLANALMIGSRLPNYTLELFDKMGNQMSFGWGMMTSMRYLKISQSLMMLGRYVEARAAFEMYEEDFERNGLFRIFRPNPNRDTGPGASLRAPLTFYFGDYESAITQAQAHVDATIESVPESEDAETSKAVNHARATLLQIQLAGFDIEKARPVLKAYEKSVRMNKKNPPEGHSRPSLQQLEQNLMDVTVLRFRAALARCEGDLERSLKYYRKADDLVRGTVGARNMSWMSSRIMIVHTLFDLDRFDEAEEVLAEIPLWDLEEPYYHKVPQADAGPSEDEVADAHEADASNDNGGDDAGENTAAADDDGETETEGGDRVAERSADDDDNDLALANGENSQSDGDNDADGADAGAEAGSEANDNNDDVHDDEANEAEEDDGQEEGREEDEDDNAQEEEASPAPMPRFRTSFFSPFFGGEEPEETGPYPGPLKTEPLDADHMAHIGMNGIRSNLEARQKFARGDLEGFVADVKAIADAQIAVNGMCFSMTLSALIVQARGLRILEEYEEAAEVLSRARQAAKEMKSANPAFLSELYTECARVNCKVGNAQAALWESADALVMIRELAPRSIIFGEALLGRAEALAAVGRQDEAEEAATQALDLFTEVSGEESSMLAETLLLIAELTGETGFAEEGLRMREDIYGPSHPLTKSASQLLDALERSA